MTLTDTLSRRHFCRQLLALAASTSIPAAFAGQSKTGDAYFDAFTAHERDLWTRGYAGISDDLPRVAMQVSGKMPAALRGTFFRNGPAHYALGGVRYHHFFDGDGLIQKYRIDGARITHEARFVQTEKFVAEKRAQRFLRAAFGTNPDGMEAVGKPDALNTANTSVVYHHGELLALWEGGSATRIDPDSLATLGLKTWRRDYAGMPFSAHPKIEPDGSFWNFGVSGLNGMLAIYRISAAGTLLDAHTQTIPQMTMVHDFAVTARHLVFLLPPLVFDAERLKNGATIAGSYVWQPALGMRVLVVDKNDLTAQHWFELPPGFVFHNGNAWEADGKIYLDYVGAPDAWSALVGMPKMMRGEYRFDEAKPHLPKITLVEIDLVRGKATQIVTQVAAEFPTIDARAVGQMHNSLYAAARLGSADRPGFDSVVRFDRHTGAVSAFRYGDDYLVEEHLLVPRPGSGRQDDGWLVGTALDTKNQVMVLSVFQPDRLADGPLAQARMERSVPFGLHGTFVATSV